MSQKQYAVGDTVVLKVNLLRAVHTDRVCEIVGLLPADHGEAQYRVRLGNEKNERRVVAGDIDAVETNASQSPQLSSFSGNAGDTWLKPPRVRIKK